MKNKLFKFFEIGKLEKGLFRIWIVLCIIYYPFFGYAFITEYSHNFEQYKMIKKDEKNNFNILCEYYTEEILLYVDGKFQSKTQKVYGFKKGYTGINLEKKFSSKSKCDGYQLIKKKQIFSELSLISFVYLISPLLLMFSYLFSKKLILWLYRGFK